MEFHVYPKGRCDHKEAVGAFYGTDLDLQLKRWRMDLCGLSFDQPENALRIYMKNK